MKTRFLGLLAALIVLASACNKTPATTSNPPADKPVTTPKPTEGGEGDAVKAAVQQLLDLATAGNCAAMAPLLALNNSNTPEDWKRGMNYDTPKEKVAVDKQCAKLQVIVTGLKDYTFEEFSKEKESEGEWNIWVVAMHYEDGSDETRTFAMLAQGNGYLLGDID